MSEFNQENQSIYNNYQQSQPGNLNSHGLKTIIVALIAGVIGALLVLGASKIMGLVE